jgi:hypothetical protein
LDHRQASRQSRGIPRPSRNPVTFLTPAQGIAHKPLAAIRGPICKRRSRLEPVSAQRDPRSPIRI